MSYTPSYRIPKFDQHVMAYKARIAYLVIDVIRNSDEYAWKALVGMVGSEEAKRLTMEAY